MGYYLVRPNRYSSTVHIYNFYKRTKNDRQERYEDDKVGKGFPLSILLREIGLYLDKRRAAFILPAKYGYSLPLFYERPFAFPFFLA